MLNIQYVVDSEEHIFNFQYKHNENIYKMQGQKTYKEI